tara:strand:+ start:5489 stop:5908 length:420 start_codon:yes stop_codon:yes gene_type:complete
MPNHVTNEVYISFKDREATDEFLEFVSGEDQEGEDLPFTFNAIIPLPNGKWDYEWCIANWGTKWDAYNHGGGDSRVSIEDEGENDLLINFLTAWGPPIPILEKINEKFGDKIQYCRWFYRDEADMFCGYLDVDVGMNHE